MTVCNDNCLLIWIYTFSYLRANLWKSSEEALYQELLGKKHFLRVTERSDPDNRKTLFKHLPSHASVIVHYKNWFLVVPRS
jgi:hypothetical protein